MLAIHRVALSSAVLCLSAAWVSAQTYQEADGIVAIEAESASSIPAQWQVESSVAGYSGSGYLRALQSSGPGVGVISYDFKINTTSDFQFAFRNRIGQGSSTTDHNDTWVRLTDDEGNGLAPIPNDNVVTGSNQWYKVYMNVLGSWTHNASNKDFDPNSLSWSLTAGNEYSLEIANRSSGHLVDRLFLWDREEYNLANQGGGWGANNGAFDALPNSVVPEPSSAALVALGAMALGWRRRVARG
ncbi:MAG: PEP-CTERM sorting domain-containing protein [Planctomycetota bacterium]